MRRRIPLQERAARCSDRLYGQGGLWDNAHDGFLAGYRAAMRDVRKRKKDKK